MSERLFHVEVKVPSVALLKARDPEPPQPRVVSKWTDADYREELRRIDRGEKAYSELLQQYIHPALRCILGARDLNDMLERCGDNAVIRISLELPRVLSEAENG